MGAPLRNRVRCIAGFFAAAAACAGPLALAPNAAAFTVPQCDRYADAATGSDVGSGSQASPFRTAQKLADSLSSDPSAPSSPTSA